MITVARVTPRFVVTRTIRSNAPAEASFLVTFRIVRLHEPPIHVDVIWPKSPTLTVNLECRESIGKCQMTNCPFRLLQASCYVVHPQWQATSVLNVLHTFSLF